MSVNTTSDFPFAAPRRGGLPRRLRAVVKLTELVPILAPDLPGLLNLAELLEAWGTDQVVLGQHLLRSTAGGHPGGLTLAATRPALDPLVTLGCVAGRTTRIGLATGAIIGPLHHAIGLAKAAATLDALSGGRLELGLVAGWDRAEFTAVGVPYEERFAQLDKTIDVCRTLWRQAPATFRGRWTDVVDVYSLPAPASETGLPILVGGRPTEATARRVAMRADGWIASEAAGIEEVRRGVRLLRSACAQQNRSVDDLVVRVTIPVDVVRSTDADALHRTVCELVDAGATAVVIPLGAGARDLADAERVVRSVGTALDTLR